MNKHEEKANLRLPRSEPYAAVLGRDHANLVACVFNLWELARESDFERNLLLCGQERRSILLLLASIDQFPFRVEKHDLEMRLPPVQRTGIPYFADDSNDRPMLILAELDLRLGYRYLSRVLSKRRALPE